MYQTRGLAPVTASLVLNRDEKLTMYPKRVCLYLLINHELRVPLLLIPAPPKT